MSREGWLVALGACLVVLIVPVAMWAGLAADDDGAVRRRAHETSVEPPLDDAAGDVAETEAPLDDPEETAPQPAEPTTRAVHGTVSDAHGVAIEGAEVALDGEPNTSATTDAEGAFELTGVSTDAVVVVVSAFGYDDAKTDVTARATTTEHDVVMAPSNDVTGTVLDPEGNPVRAAEVACVEPPGAKVRGDGLGRFSLGSKAAGCDAVARHPDFAASARVEMKLGPGNLLALRPLAAVRGVVVGRSGAPFTGFVLSLHSFEPEDGTTKMRPYRQTFAHPEGRFQVTQLPAGTFRFTVGLRGRRGVTTQPIRLRDGEQLADVKIVVE